MRQVRGVVVIVMVHEDEGKGPVQGTGKKTEEKNQKKIKTEGEEKGEGGDEGERLGRGEEDEFSNEPTLP